jgi:hypothetical protein
MDFAVPEGPLGSRCFAVPEVLSGSRDSAVPEVSSGLWDFIVPEVPSGSWDFAVREASGSENRYVRTRILYHPVFAVPALNTSEHLALEAAARAPSC